MHKILYLIVDNLKLLSVYVTNNQISNGKDHQFELLSHVFDFFNHFRELSEYECLHAYVCELHLLIDSLTQLCIRSAQQHPQISDVLYGDPVLRLFQ